VYVQERLIVYQQNLQGSGASPVKLVTSFEYPPIPWRHFDWVAFDADQMSGICGDPDCTCRDGLVRGWGETEEQAIYAFVSDLLVKHEVSLELIGGTNGRL
jgi:hypothetical protein